MSQVSENTKAASVKKHVTLMMTFLIGFSVTPVWAQSEALQNDTHSGHSMSDTSMPTMDHSTMPEMDHSAMQKSSNDSGMDEMSGGTMRDGSAQGGSAPPDARDPHAYSGGYTIDSGKYALPGPRLIRLADEQRFASLLIDRLEAVRHSDNTSAAYDMQAWYGRDYDRAVLKAEGEVDNGELEEASTELLWNHALTTFWDTQLGVRLDSGEGPNRHWLAFGIQGLAPYWFEVDVSGYLGEQGRSALALEVEYELLFTQKLILQPRIEANIYGKDDSALGIGSGLSDVVAGLRLRYEIRREFAPYVGVEWSDKFGDTADYARAAGLETSETRAVAGVRFWF